jgi:hypothetical protein
MGVSLIVPILIGLVCIESSIISPTAQTQSQTAVEKFEFCRAYDQDCIILMNAVNCSASKIQSNSCTDNTLQTFNGVCACGGFDVGSNRLVETVIDSQIKSRIPNLLVYTASGSVDTCASYTSICEAFFSTINCPSAWQTFIGCAANLLTDLFANDTSCVCGSMDTASDRIKELIVDVIIVNHIPVSSTEGRVSRNKMHLFVFVYFLARVQIYC